MKQQMKVTCEYTGYLKIDGNVNYNLLLRKFK